MRDKVPYRVFNGGKMRKIMDLPDGTSVVDLEKIAVVCPIAIKLREKRELWADDGVLAGTNHKM